MLRPFHALAAIFLFSLGPALAGEHAPSNAVAVVELFTSEGCSSCPPADRLLAELDREGMSHVFLLAFHVDYWDYLGWRDRFADEAFSQRQRDYTRLLGERPYTPQMIVNGKTVFVGSDRSRAHKAIDEALQSAAPLSLEVRAEKTPDGRIEIGYTIAGASSSPVRLNLGIVESGLGSRVKRGENAGRNLSHERVVRAFQSVPVAGKTEGKLAMTFPEDLKPENAAIVIYAQDSKHGGILGAAETAFPL